MPPRRTDPELLRQLDAARAAGGTSVSAAVSFKHPRGRPVPSDIEAAAHAAVDRASQTCGHTADDVHVMANLAVAYVSGPEPLIRELLEQPEISGATANQPQP